MHDDNDHVLSVEDINDIIKEGAEEFAGFPTEERLFLLEGVARMIHDGVDPRQAVIVLSALRRTVHSLIHSMMDEGAAMPMPEGATNTTRINLFDPMSQMVATLWCGFLEDKVILPLLWTMCEEARTANM